MSTLQEVSDILRENGEDQLEIQMDIMSIAEGILQKMDILAAQATAENRVEGEKKTSSGVTVLDMATFQIVERITDRLTRSEQEEFQQETNSLLSDLLDTMDDIKDSVLSILSVVGESPLPMPVTVMGEEGLDSSPEASEASEESVENLKQVEESREEALGEKVKEKRSFDLKGPLAGIMGVIKSITKFFKTIALVVGAAIVGIMAFGTSEQVDKMLDAVGGLFTTISEALEPVFKYLKEDLLPKLVELIPPVLETIGLLFEKIIGPMFENFILPAASMALDGILMFFNFLSDALKNPREIAEEVMEDIKDLFLDIGDFFADAIDRFVVAVGNGLNNIIDGIANLVSKIPLVGEEAAEKVRSLKGEFAEEATQRMVSRQEASEERDRRGRELNAEKEVRRSGAEGKAAEIMKLESIQKQLIMEGKGPNDPELRKVEKELFVLKSGGGVPSPEVKVSGQQPAIVVPVRQAPSAIVEGQQLQVADIVVGNRLPENITKNSDGTFDAYNPSTKQSATFASLTEAENYSKKSILEMTPVASRVEQTSTMNKATSQNQEIKSESFSPSIVNAPTTSNVNNISSVSNAIIQDMPLAKNYTDAYSGIVGIRN